MVKNVRHVIGLIRVVIRKHCRRTVSGAFSTFWFECVHKTRHTRCWRTSTGSGPPLGRKAGNAMRCGAAACRHGAGAHTPAAAAQTRSGAQADSDASTTRPQQLLQAGGHSVERRRWSMSLLGRLAVGAAPLQRTMMDV